MSVRNFVKAKSLYFLLKKDGERIRVGQIARATGASVPSLCVLVKRWRGWGFIKWWKVGEGMNWHYEYSLLAKGRAYIKKMPNWYPFYNQAVNEVESRMAEEVRRVDEAKRRLQTIAFQTPDGFYHVFSYPYQGRTDYCTKKEKPACTIVHGPSATLRIMKSYGVRPGAGTEVFEILRDLYQEYHTQYGEGY